MVTRLIMSTHVSSLLTIKCPHPHLITHYTSHYTSLHICLPKLQNKLKAYSRPAPKTKKMKFSMRRRRAPHNSRAKAMAPSSETSSTASSNEFDSASLHHSSVAEEEVSTSSLGTHDLLPVGQKMQASLLRGTWNIDAEDQTWIDFDAKDVIQRDIDAIALSREFPDATLEECIRFRSRRSIEQARVKLKGYLEWRTFYLLDQIPPY